VPLLQLADQPQKLLDALAADPVHGPDHEHPVLTAVGVIEGDFSV
jgi:hypothetical protein